MRYKTDSRESHSDFLCGLNQKSSGNNGSKARGCPHATGSSSGYMAQWWSLCFLGEYPKGIPFIFIYRMEKGNLIDHPCMVLTFELLPYPFFHWRLNFPFQSFIQIESHSTCLWQTPTCPAWLSYCREQSCSLLALAPWSPHCLCREAMLTPNCHREQQI